MKAAPLFALVLLLTACGYRTDYERASVVVGPFEDPLYVRLGGAEGITLIADEFVSVVAADPRLNGYFARSDMLRFRDGVASQLCAAADGPCVYRGGPMADVHADMAIDKYAFNAFAEDMARSLSRLNVPVLEQTEVMAILSRMRADIDTIGN
jgi:hemoglobin